jgi:hypothetical protein
VGHGANARSAIYLPGVETDAIPEARVNMAAQTKVDCWRLVGFNRILFAIGQNR